MNEAPHNAGQTVIVSQVSKIDANTHNTLKTLTVNWGDITVTENWGRLFIAAEKESIIVHATAYEEFAKAIQHFVKPTPPPVLSVEASKRIADLAGEMWRVSTRDLDEAGYVHITHGGSYKNPRCAWYEDKITDLFLSLLKQRT